MGSKDIEQVFAVGWLGSSAGIVLTLRCIQMTLAGYGVRHVDHCCDSGARIAEIRSAAGDIGIRPTVAWVFDANHAVRREGVQLGDELARHDLFDVTEDGYFSLQTLGLELVACCREPQDMEIVGTHACGHRIDAT